MNKVKFDILSFLLLIATSVFLSLLTKDANVSPFVGFLLPFSLGIMWQNMFPIVKIEKVKDSNEDYKK